MQRLSSAVNQTGFLTPSTKEGSPSAQDPHSSPAGNTTMNPVTLRYGLLHLDFPKISPPSHIRGLIPRSEIKAIFFPSDGGVMIYRIVQA